MKRFISRKGLSLMLIVSLATTSIGLVGCSTSSNSGQATKPITLSVGLLAEDLDFFEAKVKDDSFKKALPNVTIDFQQYKDSEDMIKSQKIRQAANELPDVVYMKPDHMIELKNSLLPWSADEELVKQNKYVKSFAINCVDGGGYYGLPMKSFTEWVFYRKSISRN